MFDKTFLCFKMGSIEKKKMFNIFLYKYFLVCSGTEVLLRRMLNVQ